MALVFVWCFHFVFAIHALLSVKIFYFVTSLPLAPSTFSLSVKVHGHQQVVLAPIQSPKTNMVDATHCLCPFDEDPVNRQGCNLGSLLHEVGVDEFRALSELKSKV
jgi:hypothetical protein